MSPKAMIILGGIAVALMSVCACNRNQASADRHDPASATSGGSPVSIGGQAYASAGQGGYHNSGGYKSGAYTQDATREPTPMFHGEPMWSENRSHTAMENAEYQFKKSGADFGAKTLDEFLTKAHQFGDHPPADAQHIDRANGDKLIYAPKDNIFAVITREGAPRTIFKPHNGATYWEAQKARELAQSGGSDSAEGGRSSRSYGGQSGEDRPTYREDKADRGGQ